MPLEESFKEVEGETASEGCAALETDAGETLAGSVTRESRILALDWRWRRCSGVFARQFVFVEFDHLPL